MFCPNCGKECGTDRFCYACGTQLLYAADPLDAVRDLTYILSEKEKQDKNIQRLKSEIRDSQIQQALEDIRRDVDIIALNKMLEDD